MDSDLIPLVDLWRAIRQAREGHQLIQAAFKTLAAHGAPAQQARLNAERESDRAESRRLFWQDRAVAIALGEEARDRTDGRGRPLVVDAASDTRPGVLYQVAFLAPDEPICTCLGFSAWYHCKHQARAMSARSTDRTPALA